MGKLLNLALTEEQAFYVDPSEITAAALDRKNGRDILRLYSVQGRALHLDCQSLGMEAQDIVQKLTARSATPLLPLPVRGDVTQYYIAPQAVAFASLSEQSEEGEVKALIGIKGGGTIESRTPVAAIETLLTAASAKKTMLSYESEQVQTHWPDAERLFIDPASVTEMREQLLDRIVVDFGTAGSLDVQMNVGEKKQRVDFYFDALDEGIPKEDAEREADVRMDDYNKGLRAKLDDFADGIVAAADTDLLAVPDAVSALYVRRHEVAGVGFSKDERNGTHDMTIYKQPDSAADMKPKMLYATFNTVAQRSTAVRVLSAWVPRGQRPQEGHHHL